MDLTPTVSRTPRQRQRIWPVQARPAAVVTLIFTGLLYAVEFVDLSVYHEGLDQNGIVPREVSGLDGIVWAPLLHAGWAHLVANTVPVLVFGFLAMANGLRQWIAVTALIWVVAGVGVWLTAPPHTVTVGASGLIFGWLTFLLVRGFFNRSAWQILLGLVLFALWGGALWGLLPGNPGVSWQGHLFGAIGGILAAYLARPTRAPSARPA